MKQRTWRKLHRYLGVIIGIQLLLWTVSGAFFSFNSIQSVRGEDRVDDPELRDLSAHRLLAPWLSPKVRETIANRAVSHVEMRMMLDRPVIELTCQSPEQTDYLLIDADSLDILSPIGDQTAGEIALHDYAGEPEIASIDWVQSVTPHSEYRGKELPAWRVQFDDDRHTSIYVSANRGLVTARRNRQWRWFDWFWMLHTMDYQGRDNFNTWVLKAISCFGIATVATGFILWAQTSRWLRRRRRSRPQPAARMTHPDGSGMADN